MSGRDVAIACMLGAEEFGFATAPLITMGCAMMRVCNLDTCPFGVATQNEKLRKRFKGKPEYVMNFMLFIAQELREIMAELGFHSIDEMVGRSDCLQIRENQTPREKEIDLSYILNDGNNIHHISENEYNFKLENTIDLSTLLPKFQPYFKKQKKHEESINISSTDRTVGTILGSEITKQCGTDVKEDTFIVHCNGGAGQSFGSFIPSGLTLDVKGDANDYFGKGLSGGKLIIAPPVNSPFKAEENVIIGNVALYGATSGKAFIRGIAGERFCVRNSGAIAVVEGCGDHGLEYMTGGLAVILGKTGKNFAAGMSGGIAYVLDEDHDLYKRINKEMVSIEEATGKTDQETLYNLLQEHYQCTGSMVAKKILDDFSNQLSNFKKIIPNDYRKIKDAIKELEDKGFHTDEAELMAFESAFN